MVVGRDDGPAKILGNAVHRASVQRKRNVRMRLHQQRGSPRRAGSGDAEVRDGLLAVSPHRHGRGAEDIPQLYKQHKGEYFGSLLTGMVEGMLPMIQNDQENEVDLTEGTFSKGLNNVVKDNDLNFPPEWRLSRSGRNKP